MGLGDIFMATTMAPVVVVLGGVSLHILKNVLIALADAARKPTGLLVHAKPVLKIFDFLINKTCFGGAEIDAGNFNSIMSMAIIMALIGVSVSISNLAQEMQRTKIKKADSSRSSESKSISSKGRR